MTYKSVGSIISEVFVKANVGLLCIWTRLIDNAVDIQETHSRWYRISFHLL